MHPNACERIKLRKYNNFSYVWTFFIRPIFARFYSFLTIVSWGHQTSRSLIGVQNKSKPPIKYSCMIRQQHCGQAGITKGKRSPEKFSETEQTGKIGEKPDEFFPDRFLVPVSKF